MTMIMVVVVTMSTMALHPNDDRDGDGEHSRFLFHAGTEILLFSCALEGYPKYTR